MVKLTCLLKRKPGMSPETFHEYWRNHHGPLIAGQPQREPRPPLRAEPPGARRLPGRRRHRLRRRHRAVVRLDGRVPGPHGRGRLPPGHGRPGQIPRHRPPGVRGDRGALVVIDRIPADAGSRPPGPTGCVDSCPHSDLRSEPSDTVSDHPEATPHEPIRSRFRRHRPDRLQGRSSTESPTTGSPSCGRTLRSGGRRRRTGPGFWAVTGYEDCNTVNRDYEPFSSHSKATFIWDMRRGPLAQQQLLMLNMDPPLHTRYRRLVNKGFTPRVVTSSTSASTPPPTPSSTRSSRRAGPTS